jgi:hypothetical protein
MATTTNLALNQPAYNSSAWDVPLNANEDILDAAFGNTTSVALTNTNVTLTSAQCRAMQIRFTGTISANIIITVPAIGGRWTFTNATSGAYTVTIASAGAGTSVSILQGYSTLLFSDSTNIVLADGGVLGGSPTFTNLTVTGTATIATVASSTITSGGTLTVTGNISPSGRITPRVNSASNQSSPLAWTSNSYDEYAITALANALTINADAGSPVDGQRIIFRLKDNGTARALTWTTAGTNAFRAIGVFLPTTTTANKVTYVGAIYNSAETYWDVVGVVTQA